MVTVGRRFDALPGIARPFDADDAVISSSVGGRPRSRPIHPMAPSMLASSFPSTTQTWPTSTPGPLVVAMQ